MKVNVLLSNHTWTCPRNTYGVRHHVAALYQDCFAGAGLSLFPRSQAAGAGLLTAGIRHVNPILKGDINVLTPGFPVVAGALALGLRGDPGLIVHTWKVPGFSDARARAHLYDALLTRVMRRARAVVVASQVQKRQLEGMGLQCPVIFSPVTVDATFWHPDPLGLDEVLTKFDIGRHQYILTVGGNDRDELYGARLAHAIGLRYVRSSNDPKSLLSAREKLVAAKLDSHSTLLSHPTDEELRALYAGAHLVCLPTFTSTNPAGLTALVEAMACGAPVAIPSDLAEGYIAKGRSGFTLNDDFVQLADELCNVDVRAVGAAARETAMTGLTAAPAMAALRRLAKFE